MDSARLSHDPLMDVQDAVRKQPQHERRREMAGQVVHDQQHPQPGKTLWRGDAHAQTLLLVQPVITLGGQTTVSGQPFEDVLDFLLQPGKQQQLEDILNRLPPGSGLPAERETWLQWQQDLEVRITLPKEPERLRMLLVMGNLAGHLTPSFVGWMFDHGIIPLYTPVGGS